MKRFRLFPALVLPYCLFCHLSLSAADGQRRFLAPASVVEQGCTTVRDISRDSLGFVWFATPDGLYRYDGFRTRIYKGPDVNISYQGFRDVFTDGGGNLWSRNFANTYFYDYRTDSLTLEGSAYLASLGMEAELTSLMADQEGNLWAASADGTLYCHRFMPEGATFSFPIGEGGFFRAAARGDRAIVLTGSGALLRIEPGGNESAQKLGSYPLPVFTNDLGLYIDSEEHLWIYDAGNYGPYCCLDTKTGAPQDLTRLRQRLGGDHLNDILEDRDGRLWFATEKSGLLCYDPDTNDFIPYRKDAARTFSIPSDCIESLYIYGNSLWAGTHYCGPVYTTLVSPVERYVQTPETSAINMLLEDGDGRLWVGHDSEGIRIYEADGRSRRVEGLPNETVLSAATDSLGRIWFGSYGGGVFYYENGRFWVPEALKGHPEMALCQALHFDAEGTLWIASCDRGLYSMDRSGHVRSYPGTMSTDFLTALAYNPRNRRLYIGTSVGLYCADTATGRIRLLDLYDPGLSNERARPSVICLCVDGTGRTWVGSYNGINVLGPDDTVLRHIESTDGQLSGDIVRGLIDDGEGRIWAATDGGFTCITPGADDAEPFTRSYPSIGANNAFNPVRGAFCRTADGRIIFGSEGCYVLINPRNLPQEAEASHVVLTDLHVNGTYARSLQTATDVRLSHDEAAYFTIGIASLNLDNLIANRFRYRLSAEEPWKYCQEHTLSFQELPYGSYELEVQVAGADGRYSPSRKLSLTIAPPWWLSLPAQLTYLLVLLLAGAWLFHFIRKKHRLSLERQRLALEESNRKRMEAAEKEILTRMADSRLLQRVNEAVNRHLGETEYSVEDICTELGISRSGLYKKIVAITGISPLEYVHLIRVKKGKELLDEGETTISQAAWKAGLSPKQFAKYFREYYGQLPSDYIREAQP